MVYPRLVRQSHTVTSQQPVPYLLHNTRTFQEIVLSRRMLVFSATETFFYCPRGVLSEGICFGDNANESLRTESWSRVSSIGLCGTIHQAIATLNGPSTLNIAKRRILYDDLFLGLLRPYMRRTLRYDADILNAFSGIVNALGYFLGAFHWGMPTAVLGRALLMSTGATTSNTWTRRPNFPSWSWLGWKHTGDAADLILKNVSLIDERTLSILIHIYILAPDNTTLLLGPRSDAHGTEGYCPRSIAQYNQLSHRAALPQHPSLERGVHLPRKSAVDASHVLVFYTHVARFRLTDAALEDAAWQFEDASWRERLGVQTIKVVLVAVSTIALPREEHRWGAAASFDSHEESEAETETFGPHEHKEFYHGVIVRRHRGVSRRVGVVARMTRMRWLAGKPRKELIFLA